MTVRQSVKKGCSNMLLTAIAHLEHNEPGPALYLLRKLNSRIERRPRNLTRTEAMARELQCPTP